MSAPGYWKTGKGDEIPYRAMEDSHVKHALRYLRRRRIELAATPNSSWYKYVERKLEELGDEAQSRNLLPPGDLTMEQLLEHIAEWQAAWDRHTRPVPNISRSPVYVTPSTLPPAPMVAPPVPPNEAAEMYTQLTTPTRAVPLADLFVSKVEHPAVKKVVKPFKKAPMLSLELNIEVEISKVTGYYIQGPIDEMNLETDRRLDLDL